MMTIRLLFFAQFREALGEGKRTVEVERGATPGVVLARVSAGNQRLESLQSVVRFLVNGELVRGDIDLQDGDELAFVPPVAGG